MSEVRAALVAGDAGQVIRLIRRETDLSQTSIAKMAEVSQATISGIDGGGSLESRKRNQAAFRGLGAPDLVGEPEQLLDAPTTSLKTILVDGTDRSTLVGMEQELAEISTSYVSRPSAPLLPRLRALRATALERYRLGARPSHAHELLVILGACELLLAYAAHDGGNPAQALTHLDDAARCADFTDHPYLPGWIIGTRALIGDWHSTSTTSTLALPGHTPNSQAWTRLTAITTRAAARRHDMSTARSGLDRLLDQPLTSVDSQHDDLTRRLGGMFTFSEPKRDYYIASTAVLLGDGALAAEHADKAITAYETGPAIQRSYGDLALARIDLVSAHLIEGDADSAGTALERVAQIPKHDRIHQLRPALKACADQALNAPIPPGRKREIFDRLSELRLPWGT